MNYFSEKTSITHKNFLRAGFTDSTYMWSRPLSAEHSYVISITKKGYKAPMTGNRRDGQVDRHSTHKRINGQKL